MYRMMVSDLKDNFCFENILQTGISLLRILMPQVAVSESMSSLRFWDSHIISDLKARDGAYEQRHQAHEKSLQCPQTKACRASSYK